MLNYVFKVGDIVMVKYELSKESPIGIVVDVHEADSTTTVNGKIIHEYVVHFTTPQSNWRTGNYFGDEIIHVANIDEILV